MKDLVCMKLRHLNLKLEALRSQQLEAFKDNMAKSRVVL